MNQNRKFIDEWVNSTPQNLLYANVKNYVAASGFCYFAFDNEVGLIYFVVNGYYFLFVCH